MKTLVAVIATGIVILLSLGLFAVFDSVFNVELPVVLIIPVILVLAIVAGAIIDVYGKSSWK